MATNTKKMTDARIMIKAAFCSSGVTVCMDTHPTEHRLRAQTDILITRLTRPVQTALTMTELICLAPHGILSATSSAMPTFPALQVMATLPAMPASLPEQATPTARLLTTVRPESHAQAHLTRT